MAIFRAEISSVIFGYDHSGQENELADLLAIEIIENLTVFDRPTKTVNHCFAPPYLLKPWHSPPRFRVYFFGFCALARKTNSFALLGAGYATCNPMKTNDFLKKHNDIF